MLKDDVRVMTQQVLVTNRPTKHNEARNFKPSSQLRQTSKMWDGQQQQNQARLTPLNISYDKLLPMISDLSEFRWPEPIKTDPTKQD